MGNSKLLREKHGLSTVFLIELSEYLLKNMADNQRKDADDLAAALAEMEAKPKNWETMIAARGQAREQIENENGQQLDSEKKAMDKEDEALLASVAKKLLQDSVLDLPAK